MVLILRFDRSRLVFSGQALMQGQDEEMNYKEQWVSKGHIVLSTVFFVLCAFFIFDCLSQTRVIESGAAAPGVLERAPESFRLRLRAESGSFPVEEMTKTEAWSELQKKVSAYAQRLELLQQQNRHRSMIVALLYLVSAVSMGALATMKRMARLKDADVREPLKTT